jgi:DNA-binding response OmpR family regulator
LLDVHLSWLREVLEEELRHPRYMKTVDGVGYRLDLEPDTKPLPK